MTETTQSAPTRQVLVMQLLRSLFHLVAVLAITFWAFASWPLPLPGLVVGLAALVLSVLLWALFLSPRPVLRSDRFVQSLIELVLLGSAVAAMLMMGANAWLAGAFFVIGAALGYFAGRSN